MTPLVIFLVNLIVAPGAFLNGWIANTVTLPIRSFLADQTYNFIKGIFPGA